MLLVFVSLSEKNTTGYFYTGMPYRYCAVQLNKSTFVQSVYGHDIWESTYSLHEWSFTFSLGHNGPSRQACIAI